MWRIWKSVKKGIRYFNVASSNNSPSLSDTDAGCSSQCWFNNSAQSHSFSQEQQSTNHHGLGSSPNTFNYYSRKLDYPGFLEICGLSSAAVLGWQLSQPSCFHHGHCRDNDIQQKGNQQPSLLSILARVVLAHPVELPRTGLNINSASQVSSLHYLTNTSGVCHGDSTIQATTDPSNKSISEEIMETMAGMVTVLQEGDDARMAEWQNSIGADLLSHARNGKISSYDHLIPVLTGNRAETYRREAFLCFEESKRLGSIKGAFNLGLCYEQGLGTQIDLEKAVECYEEAARKGHSGAQYNLGLIHFQGKLNGRSDHSKAVSLMRQAARQGLEQAWTALLVALGSTGSIPSTRDLTSSTWSLSGAGDVCEDLHMSPSVHDSFRKTHSEPHGFGNSSLNLDELLQVQTAPAYKIPNGPVSFYLGDY